MTTEVPPPPPPAEAAPKPSGFDRVIGVLISPGATFASIARQPDFWVPVILLVVVSLVAGIILAQRVDFVAPMREQMEERGAPQSQIESTVRFMTPFFKGISYASPILAIIFLLVISAAMLLAFRAMGGEGDFRQAFAVTAYAWMPEVIKSAITTIIVASKSGLTAVDLATVVRSNPGFLVTMKEHTFLFSLLTSIDVFGIWTLVLFVIGFAYVSKFSKAKSAAIVITVRLIVLLLGLIGPAIQALRSK